MADWQSFRFDNPTAPWQVQFNALAAQDPMQAFAWAVSPSSGHAMDLKHAVDTKYLGSAYNPEGNSWANSIGNAIINSFNEPGGSYNSQQALGLPQGWQPPAVPRTTGAQQPTQQPAPQPTQQPAQQPLPGYGPSYGLGEQQTLNNFGIPGFETSPMVGGGSWAGTTWNGAPYTGLVENPIPNSDVTNPASPYYRGPVTNPDGTPISPGLTIRPAVPYQTTWNLQTYSGKKAPFLNIHEQMGEAMKGIQAAKPGFGWASPQALAALGGYGLPGGWTSMLGFTPGGSNGR